MFHESNIHDSHWPGRTLQLLTEVLYFVNRVRSDDQYKELASA